MTTGGVLATGPDKEKIFDELVRIKKADDDRLHDSLDRLKLTGKQRQQVKKLLTTCLQSLLRDKTLTAKTAFNNEWSKLREKDAPSLMQMKSAILAELTKLNEKKAQIVIAGYPPFLNDLICYVKEQGLNFADFDAIGIVGGQAISEALRELLIREGLLQVYSSYGASDLDINLGVETEFEMTVRKAIEKKPELAQELYGDYQSKGLPMIFHFDPLNYHVECSKDNDLIYTCTRSDRSSPRIRYNLKDKGRVYASSDVQALLAKHGIFAQPKTNLPLMFVWGRESTVVYRGANLAFTELERAVTEVDPTNQVIKKALYTHIDDKGVAQVELFFELNDGVSLNEIQRTEFSKLIVKKLMEINQDFRSQIDYLDEYAPILNIRFFERGHSPISEAGGHRKQVLVFDDNKLKGFKLEENEHAHCVTPAKDDEIINKVATLK